MSFEIQSTAKSIEITDSNGSVLLMAWDPRAGCLAVSAENDYCDCVALDFVGKQPVEVVVALQAWMEQL